MLRRELSIPGHVVTQASLYGAFDSSYVPLARIAEQLRKAVLNNDIERLERLWVSLQGRYDADRLLDCLVLPCPHTRKASIILAAERDSVTMVSWLLAQGVEDGGMTRCPDGNTILHIAAARDCTEIITMYHSQLCQAYDDEESDTKLVDWTNSRGASPLFAACEKGSEESAIVLLTLGAQVNAVDNDGNTPLHLASMYGHIALIQLIIHHGGNAFTRNNHSYTASDVAYSYHVEQEIQNIVRSKLEANKRARKIKPVITTALRAPPSPEIGTSDEDDTLVDTPTFASPRPPLLPSFPLTGTKSPVLGSSLAGKAFSPSSNASGSASLPLPSPSLSAESSRALQRIFARDQNAQADFQASSLIRGLSVSTQGMALNSQHLTSSSLRRERSSSTDLTFGSTSSLVSPVAPLSPVGTPGSGLRGKDYFNSSPGAFGTTPLPPLPLTAIPTLSSSASSHTKGTTISLVNRLRRSGSGGSRPPVGLASPLAYREPGKPALRPPLKHHASLADLRSPTASASSALGIPLSPASISFSKNIFSSKTGGKVRARAGT